jgi:DNA mismatch repair ATPase MutS
MKVFLMHRDRDLDIEQKLPFNENDLIADLGLNTLFETMADGDEYLLGVAKQVVLSSLEAQDEILYRQDILKDCLKNPSVIREIYQIPLEAIANRRKRWMGIFTKYPGGVLSGGVQLLEMFVVLLKRLKQIADEHSTKFESEGFRRFFTMIQQELDDEYFSVIDNHIKRLKFRNGVMVSAELGKGNEGANYTLRKAWDKSSNWVKRIFSRKPQVYSFRLYPRDDAGAKALGELRDRGVNIVANAVAQSADHIDSFLTMLRLELAFYMGCLNLSERLASFKEPIAFPEPMPVHERFHSFTGLYDVALALIMKKKVVGNDVNAQGKDLAIITGANQGGKSTFLRSIGLAQLMMQCGMFVAAEDFRANICTAVFTHYKREEDSTMTSGKFDEELSRMSAIVDNAVPGALMLFNESFAATNEREGSEIAKQIVTALLESHMKVFFVTHMYELAYGFYSKNMPNAIFLRADRQDGGQRTYKLRVGEPLQTSFGLDAYKMIFGK